MRYTNAGAAINGKFRFSLWREWREMDYHDDANWYLGPDKVWRPRPVLFIMLNPSTADGKKDDPTIRKCVKYARRWKYERMEVVNLFAYRATSPDEMKKAMAGARSSRGADEIIVNSVERAGVVVCAWGKHGRFLGRDHAVMQLLKGHEAKLKVLAFNGDGTPKHPLYCKDDAQLEPMRWMI